MQKVVGLFILLLLTKILSAQNYLPASNINGTINTIPVFTGANTLSNSVLSQPVGWDLCANANFYTRYGIYFGAPYGSSMGNLSWESATNTSIFNSNLKTIYTGYFGNGIDGGRTVDNYRIINVGLGGNFGNTWRFDTYNGISWSNSISLLSNAVIGLGNTDDGSAIRISGNNTTLYGSLSGKNATFSGKLGISNLYPQASLDLGSASTQNNYHFPLFWYNDDNNGPYSGTKGGIYLDQFGLPNNTTFSFGTSSANDGTLMFASKDTYDPNSTSLTPRLTIRGQSGFIGIGTVSPTNRFQLKSQGGEGDLMRITANANANSIIQYFSDDNGTYSAYGGLVNSSNWSGLSYPFVIQTNDRPINIISSLNSPTSGMLITNGNVLIGKTSQSNSNYKLDVAGNIRANKLVVNTTGADYVFDSSYKLKPLEEVEEFIKKNKHLPEIESAKKMNEDGLNVGDNQTKLLQKIEELTLYIIELKKQNDVLQKKVEKHESLLMQKKLK